MLDDGIEADEWDADFPVVFIRFNAVTFLSVIRQLSSVNFLKNSLVLPRECSILYSHPHSV